MVDYNKKFLGPKDEFIDRNHAENERLASMILVRETIMDKMKEIINDASGGNVRVIPLLQLEEFLKGRLSDPSERGLIVQNVIAHLQKELRSSWSFEVDHDGDLIISYIKK